MAISIPKTMRSLCIRRFGTPSKWEIADLPTPKITRGDEVLVKVHAAAINPTDIGAARGKYWPAFNVPLPYKIGYDLAGTVVERGSEVTKFNVGDEVFCCLPFKDRGKYGTGAVSEYALLAETLVVSKPRNLNFMEAASIPMVALTALQMLDKVPGGVQGKTVFIPAGLSGVGSAAVQMAKNSYGAEKVITTVSTRKIPMIDGLMSKGVVDESIDYTKVNPAKMIPDNSIDVMIDSIGATFSSLALLKNGGMIVACAGPPSSGRNLRNISTDVPFLIEKILDFVNGIVRWWVGRYQVKFDTVLMKSNGTELERIKTWVEEGKLRPVVGKVLKFADLEGIKEECGRIMKGRGGVGKVVIDIIAD
ncbi:NADPH-dependent alkenal/one oxidoreductase-like protein [Lachnellula hyalina]|uniref:NADPH-dependent alkenal/one oxidoreductase-like protein n=1 Tax=Lachnellula hyalina TaxID=1316788 RepID=A0A8H8QXX8_9HELO|nr:NADPH-dependent alkenal/one oxidoreductase-like protein [Lachnellula hyalina]TVY24898.1 NADPH-dependent alkenal/one oxidoreductase-like protein [Lachnellula hyalina]